VINADAGSHSAWKKARTDTSCGMPLKKKRLAQVTKTYVCATYNNNNIHFTAMI